MAFGRSSSSDIPDGYREARDGEEPDMTLNGVDLVKTHNGLAAHNTDDGRFGKGDVANDHYEDTFDPDKRAKRSSAARDLSDAERGATKDGAKDAAGADSKDAVTAQSAKESAVPADGTSGFKSSVKGRDVAGKGKGKGKGKGFLKKGGPVVAILAALLGFGGLSTMTQAFMPFSLISQFQSNFDSIGISNNLRTKTFLKIQLDGGRVKNCTKATIFGTKFKISKKQKAKLAQSGINVEGKGKNTVLTFTDYDGTKKTVTADNFESMYNSNEKFRTEYYEGSRTWRGAVGDWFDNMSRKFFDWLGIHRNNFADFRKTGDADEDQEQFKNKVTEIADEDSVDGKTKSIEGEKTEDDEGNEQGKLKKSDDDTLSIDRDDVPTRADGSVDTAKLKTEDDSALTKKINDFSNSKIAKASSIASALASGACGILNVAGAIGLIVAAYQTTQILKTASMIFEGIQKGQIEDSNIAPLNEIANSLITPAETTYLDGEYGATEITTKKSAMEANSIGALYGNTATNSNDPSVKSFNIMASLKSISGALKIGLDAFKACTFVKMAAATVGIAEDVVCVVTLGLGCILDVGATEIIMATVSVTVSLALPYIIPMVAKIFTRKIATEVAGEDLGNALVSGANIYMGTNHQYSGGSVATKDTLMSYISARDQVIAEQARYERENLSPFSADSQYTFMGSLLTTLVPLSTQMSTLSGGLASFSNIVSRSFSSIMPGASAVSAAKTAQEAAERTAEDCVYLDSIGAVGDAFCNPYYISDLDTINKHPADIVEKINNEYGGFEDPDEETEVPTIKDDSKLAQYIEYCTQRQSPFGVADQNIASDLDSTSTGSNVADTLVGMVPFVGDTIDIISNAEQAYNYGYISGEACVTKNNTTTLSWDEAQYYQRFIEDQRLAENMGLVEKSSVTAFLDKYYSSHPLDNSTEGILARRSGLSKESISEFLEIIDEVNFIANYDPRGLAPIQNNIQQEAQKISFYKTDVLRRIDTTSDDTIVPGRRNIARDISLIKMAAKAA